MDILKPSPALLCKLGSILVHAEELADPKAGHIFDKHALDSLLTDAEVLAWRKQMSASGMLPVKRSERSKP